MAISTIQGYGGLAQLCAAVCGSSTDEAPAGATSGADGSADVLELSAEGQAAADAAQESTPLSSRSLFGLDLADGESISITDLEAAQQKAQSSIRAKLHDLFASEGIDTTQEIQLQIGADGQVYVMNDHPQREQIQQLFADDPTLRDDFCEFQCLTETVGAIREGIAFQRAYANDPEAAVAQYWYLFDSGTKASASLSIQGDEYQALYGRPGLGFEVIGE